MSRRDTSIALALALAVFGLYARSLGFEFVDLDDRHYLLDNPVVRAGLTWHGLAWAFTTFDVGNWHPLTWLSHMLDCQLFGLEPAGHHATNALLHAANAALLYGALRQLGLASGPSLFAAALFALHPLRVESVAWVAERKDLLCGSFWLLSLAAWARWVARPDRRRYAAVAALLALALLSKPMAVTLPFVLLLLDRWPLGRREGLTALVVEKLPLLALVALSSAVTLLAQSASRFVAPFEHYPLGLRLAHAPVSYVGYLGHTLWPLELAVYYPHPGAPAPAALAAAVLLLAALSAAAFALRDRHPALGVGWLWFLGTLIPVIGIVQVGGQASADRYTYLPGIGLALALAVELPRALHRLPRRAFVLGALAAAVLALCAGLTWRQLGTWRDSPTLFRHALAVAGPSALVETALANALYARGAYEEATAHYRAALALAPDDVEAENGLAAALLRLGRPHEAESAYRRALARAPERTHLRYNLALALLARGARGEAIAELEDLVRRDPSAALARVELGIALAGAGRPAPARAQLEAALALEPTPLQAGDRVRARNALGVLYAGGGRPDRALEQFARALEEAPEQAELHYNLGLALLAQGRSREATAQFRETLRLDPGHAGARRQLARPGTPDPARPR